MKSRLLPLTGVLLVAGLLASCSAPTTPSSPPAVPGNPTNEPVEPTTPSTPEAPANNIVEVAQADLAEFEGMSSAEIAALPDAEQARFVALTNIVNFEDYEKSWKYWAATQDQTIPDVSIDSDPQDIANYTTWQLRLNFLFTGDERDRYFEASRYNGSNSYLYDDYQSVSAQLPTRVVGGAAAQNNIFPLETILGAENTTKNDDGTATRLITIEGIGGVKTVPYHYNEVTLSDGTVVPIWRAD